MITVHGWNGTAATLGLTKSALEARVYEVKGSGMRVDTALLIQAYAGTSHFAQAVAAASGGVFVALPDVGAIDGDDLQAKFHELYAELGLLSQTYSAAIKDGEIDAYERAALDDIAQKMHRTMKELMATMFQVYCQPGARAPFGDGGVRP
ncbi:MAG: hypothetical protein H7Z39_16350 [Burkholderiaceae bacterium]|nr:hypothetical protein [Burkholderiaceae bacterium]